jgi:hypothetical protein
MSYGQDLFLKSWHFRNQIFQICDLKCRATIKGQSDLHLCLRLKMSEKMSNQTTTHSTSSGNVLWHWHTVSHHRCCRCHYPSHYPNLSNLHSPRHLQLSSTRSKQNYYKASLFTTRHKREGQEKILQKCRCTQQTTTVASTAYSSSVAGQWGKNSLNFSVGIAYLKRGWTHHAQIQILNVSKCCRKKRTAEKYHNPMLSQKYENLHSLPNQYSMKKDVSVHLTWNMNYDFLQNFKIRCTSFSWTSFTGRCSLQFF